MPIARIRSDKPTSAIKTVAPTARAEALSVRTVYRINGGTPIGLLLALTYSSNFTVLTSGVNPKARIRNAY